MDFLFKNKDLLSGTMTYSFIIYFIILKRNYKRFKSMQQKSNTVKKNSAKQFSLENLNDTLSIDSSLST